MSHGHGHGWGAAGPCEHGDMGNEDIRRHGDGDARVESGADSVWETWGAADGPKSPLMLTYEALLARAEHVALVRAAQREVERTGGRIRIYPPNAAGMTLVELALPATIRPDAFFPGLPFSLV